MEETLPAVAPFSHTVTVSRKRLVLVLAGIMLGMSLGALDQTVVGTAMPRVIAELNGMEHYAWVFAAYMLASTVMIPIYGKLSDIYGRRPFFLGGMFLFLLGSALSGASQNMMQLILFRAVQGLGAGAVMPMVQAITGDLFSPIERGKWQGAIMSLWGLATIVGPAIGGWITDLWGWRWVFYVNLPVGALAIVTAGIALPATSRHTQHRIDFAGSSLLIIAAVPFLLAFSWAGTDYAWLSAPIISLLGFSAAMFVLFFWYEARAPEPIVNPSFFRNSIFAVSVVATFLLSAGMFSALVYTPLFVQGVMGESATGSGAVMTPHMVAFMVSNVIGGQILSRTGRYKALALICFATATFGMALLALMDVQTTHEIVVRNVVIMGFGLGIMMTLFTIVVQNAFPSTDLGQVTANLQFFRSIGATMGTAILGTVLTSHFQAGFQTALPDTLRQAVPPERLASFQNPQVLLSAQAMEAIRSSFLGLGPQGGALFDQLMLLIRSSLSDAISTVFIVSAAAMALGLIIAFFLREMPLRTTKFARPSDPRPVTAAPVTQVLFFTGNDQGASMDNRIERLRQSIRVDGYPLAIEKIRLTTESFQETEGQPQIWRRAKVFAHVLDHITIFIEDDELIVGNTASKPMAVEFDCDYGTWSRDEIQALRDEGYAVSAADEAELINLNQYWKGKTLISHLGQKLDDERLWPFVQSGLVLPPWKNREEGSGGGYAQSGMGLGPGFFLVGFDYPRVLECGLSATIQQAQAELTALVNQGAASTAVDGHPRADSVTKSEFLRALIITHEAIIRFADRFSRLAAELASRESRPTRAQELREIAEVCARVPAYPARTVREAIQSFWFMFLMTTPQTTAAAGRFDQYMYPFYKKDMERGVATDEQVLELLQCLRIKDMQLNRTSGKLNRQKNAGMAKWHNWTIGGVKRDGTDATNELTYLVLEAAKRCPTPHHTITLRVHDGTPERLMLKALEVIRTGIGMPAFIGDQSYMGYLLEQGMPLEEARDYIMTGCLDVNIVGKSRIASYPMFIVPLAFDIFMHNGKDPNTGLQVGLQTGEMESFASFDELMQAFQKQLAYLMGLAAERNNLELCVARELFPDPVRSSLMTDAIHVGKDMLDRKMPLENGAVLNAVGMINVADSLAAIRRLVYDEKKVTLLELKQALRSNWQGEGCGRIRKLCLAAPKYGNDDDYADSMAAELYRFWAETTASLDTTLGGRHKPAAISITSQAPGGALTGATPDGRFAGECLADGTMSAMRGRDTRGITGLVKSAAKINQVPYQSTLMNVRFHPTALATTEDLSKLSTLIRTYFAMGGKHMQFNVVRRDTLLDAQKHPENYRDLVVRVAGYSAYFTQLSKTVQDEIIGRTEHQVV